MSLGTVPSFTPHFLTCSRTWLYYKLKGLDGIVALINAGRSNLAATGWDIAEGIDHVNGFKNTKEIYLKADPNYANRYTVPILWDQKLQTIGLNLLILG
jgi:glutathionyl-hydroquinone reductase